MAILIDKANAGTAANDAGSTTIAVSTTQAVASSGFIIANVGWWHASATLSSVSGGGLTWTIAVQGKHSSNSPAAAIVYAQAPAGLASATTITATFSTTVNARAIGIMSFTGVATSSPVDTTDPVVSDNDNTWTTNSVAIAAGSVLVAHAHDDTTGTSTITSPSIEALDWGDGSNFSNTVGYRIEASASSYSVAGTWSTGSFHVTVAAAFKVAAGGTNATVTAVVADSAGSAPVAAISAGSDVTVTAVVADSAGSAPVAALSTGSTVTAVVADSVGSAPPANQIISFVLNVPAVIGLGSAPVASVSAGGSDATITAVVADSAGSAPAATLQTGSTVTAVVSDSTGSAPAGSVAQGTTVTAVPALSHGEAPRATVSPAPAGGGVSGDVAATFAEAG